jgi:Ca2+-binding EF-hand superfamily protein
METNVDGLINYTAFLTAAFNKKAILTKENLEKVFNLFDKD